MKCFIYLFGNEVRLLFYCASASVFSHPTPTVDDSTVYTNNTLALCCLMSVIKVDVPNKWASARYEARIKANNYTIISQQFNDISHPWRQNIGSHHLPRYTRYRVIAGRVIKGGDCMQLLFMCDC